MNTNPSLPGPGRRSLGGALIELAARPVEPSAPTPAKPTPRRLPIGEALLVNAVTASDTGGVLDSLLASVINTPNTNIYDKAIDSVYLSTGTGGSQLHHLLDGQHDLVGAFSAALSAWVRTDVVQPDSQIRAHLESLVRGLGKALQQDTELRDMLNERLRGHLLALAEANRGLIADFVRETVAKWDAEELCRNLEAEVGRDLQFIRINGTVVGGLVGLGLHLLTRLF